MSRRSHARALWIVALTDPRASMAQRAQALILAARAFSRGSVKLPFKAAQSAIYGERRAFLADSIGESIATIGHEGAADLIRRAVRFAKDPNFARDLWTAYGATGQRLPGYAVAIGPAVGRPSSAYLPSTSVRPDIGRDRDTRGAASPEYRNPVQRAGMAEIRAILNRSDLGILESADSAEFVDGVSPIVRAMRNAGTGAIKYLIGRGIKAGLSSRHTEILRSLTGLDSAGLTYRRALAACVADPTCGPWMELDSAESMTRGPASGIDPDLDRLRASATAMIDRMRRDAPPIPAIERPKAAPRTRAGGTLRDSGLESLKSRAAQYRAEMPLPETRPNYRAESRDRTLTRVAPTDSRRSYSPILRGRCQGAIGNASNCLSVVVARCATTPAGYPPAGQGMQS